MKKILTVIFAIAMSFGVVLSVVSEPVFADAPEMNVLTMCKDSREGKEAIGCVLNLVVNIMTYGIGVLGVVGIVLSGIQYITSQGDPAKMTKAKNRIVQVVIGLVIYAVMYAALVFLVPGFSTNIT